MRYPTVRQRVCRTILVLFCCVTSVALAGGAARFATLNGADASLDEYTGEGKWLVVKIWASTCHVCNETAHEMVALTDQRKHDVQVLGIAVDGLTNRDGVLAFIERHGLNYPTLLDDGRGAAHEYRRGVQSDWGGWTPTYLIFNPDGKLVAQNIGAVAARDVIRFVDGFSGQTGS